jgi:hypothetical protein
MLINAMCTFILRQRRRNFFLCGCKLGRLRLPNLQPHKKIIAKSAAMRFQKNRHIGLINKINRKSVGADLSCPPPIYRPMHIA